VAEEREDPAPAATPPDGDAVDARRLIAIAAATLVLGLLVALALATGGSDSGEGNGERAFADGLLTVVEADRLVMNAYREVDGRRQVEFVVRPGDPISAELPHLREHSATGFPTRVFYERQDGRLYVESVVDAPVPGG